jgi:chaperonin GroEL
MAKQLVFGAEARTKLKNGIDQLAEAVGSTLGPKGRNVVISKQFSTPHVTKDGVSVAKEVELEDQFENMGVQLLREAASKTADAAGDGTTTSTILAHAMVEEGLKIVAAGGDPISIKRGIDRAVEAVITELNGMAIPLDGDSGSNIEQIATISANNDSAIGSLIADAVKRVKRDGVITVEEAKGVDTTVEIVEGMQFMRGYLSPYFSTNNQKMTADLESPVILLVDKKISSMQEMVPVLEQVAKAGRSLLIIAEDIEAAVLGTLVVNKINGALRVAAVKAPGFGDSRKEQLRDIAALTGGVIISDETGHKFDTVSIDDLGVAEKAHISKDKTTIINGGGESNAIEERVNQLKIQIEDSKSDYDKEKLEERLAKLAGGVAVLYVGAATESEMKEKKDRVDDALAATRAAIEEGYVVGGGVALLQASKALDKLKIEPEYAVGVDIVRRALQAPIMKIAENAGKSGAVVISETHKSEPNNGYNARTDRFENLIDAGVIDPKKVTRIALENAASAAGMILLTNCIMAEIKSDDAEPQGMQMPMM